MGIHRHHHDDSMLAAASAPPSNERLLCTAFISFQCFSIAQTVAAIIAGSEALLGDSFAMMVDAFTYLFNWYAERQKVLYSMKLQRQSVGASSFSLRALEYRKYTYQLELIPPLISVSTLLVVTVFVLKKSIGVLVLDAKRDVSEQADPNVKLMMLFSCLNLMLDVLNVGCFASAKHALGYNTTAEMVDVDAEKKGNERMDSSSHQRYSDNGGNIVHNHARIQGNGTHHNEGSQCDIEMMERKTYQDDGASASNNGENDSDEDHEDHDYDELSPIRINEERHHHGSRNKDNEEPSNLNMCSAYTHVFADTLRSLAVILASVLAEFTSAVTSEVADATAAVVVSLLIMLSLLPLLGGMVTAFGALQKVNQQILMERIQQGQQSGTEEIELLDENDEEDNEVEEIMAEPSNTKVQLQFV
jgi:Co/Zn/Cd efflux system component